MGACYDRNDLVFSSETFSEYDGFPYPKIVWTSFGFLSMIFVE